MCYTRGTGLVLTWETSVWPRWVDTRLALFSVRAIPPHPQKNLPYVGIVGTASGAGPSFEPSKAASWDSCSVSLPHWSNSSTAILVTDSVFSCCTRISNKHVPWSHITYVYTHNWLKICSDLTISIHHQRASLEFDRICKHSLHYIMNTIHIYKWI